MRVSISTATGSGDYPTFALAAGEHKTGVDITAQDSGTVIGRLIDRATGQPALGLIVYFQAAPAHVPFPVDGNGRFEAQVPPGSYTRVGLGSFAGGRALSVPPAQRAFTVAADETTDLGDVLVDVR
jgi:hypothetical protein